jgi:hypothetical protein
MTGVTPHDRRELSSRDEKQDPYAARDEQAEEGRQ